MWVRSDRRLHNFNCHRSPLEAALPYEPDLDEVLDDPVVQTVMCRDGVTRGEILALMVAVSARIAPPGMKTRSAASPAA
jgi:hypothetical protein